MKVDIFREKTLMYFHEVGDMSLDNIEDVVKEYIATVLEEYAVEAEIVGCVVNGSRSRGIEKVNSDLDVVVELKTNKKEDYLFNILNAEGWCLNGIRVDINPITANQTGSIEEYLDAADKYLEEKMMDVNRKWRTRICISHRR